MGQYDGLKLWLVALTTLALAQCQALVMDTTTTREWSWQGGGRAGGRAAWPVEGRGRV